METFRQILDYLTTTSGFGLSLIESEGMVLRVLELSGDENRRVMETLIRNSYLSQESEFNATKFTEGSSFHEYLGEVLFKDFFFM